jgi:hypothetical protein
MKINPHSGEEETTIKIASEGSGYSIWFSSMDFECILEAIDENKLHNLETRYFDTPSVEILWMIATIEIAGGYHE